MFLVCVSTSPFVYHVDSLQVTGHYVKRLTPRPAHTHRLTLQTPWVTGAWVSPRLVRQIYPATFGTIFTVQGTLSDTNTVPDTG